ncbi:MAG: sugar ABC transporter permease [Acutalibacter sp.]|nr:sugar ABC transporter permease [Acutalibacter sp.]
MKKSLSGVLLTAPLLAGCLVFYAVPFGITLWYSLTSGRGASAHFVGLEHYKSLLKNHNFLLAFGNTMAFLAVGLPLIMVLSYLIALLFQKQAGKHQLLKSVFLLPYIMPVAGTVLLVNSIFTQDGALNAFSSLLGAAPKDWLSGPQAFGVVVLLFLWKNSGYSTILLLAGLVTIPGDQYESADLDGATSWQKFLYITTPQMWYSVFFALVFSVINSFKCFREIFLIGGQHPHSSIYMLQHFINNGFAKLNYARLSVASVLLLLVLLIFFASFYRFVRKREV